MQGHLKNLLGKPSGFIEELPTKIQGRIEYLRQLQDKHSDIEEQFQEELAALKAKFLTLFGGFCAVVVISVWPFHYNSRMAFPLAAVLCHTSVLVLKPCIHELALVSRVCLGNHGLSFGGALPVSKKMYHPRLYSSLQKKHGAEVLQLLLSHNAKHSGIQNLYCFLDVWQAVNPIANVHAEPLYVKRKAVVTGSEEPPAVTTSEEMSTEQDDQADVPAGIPEFWLNVLRANTITQAKVSTWEPWEPFPSDVPRLHLHLIPKTLKPIDYKCLVWKLCSA